MSDHGNPYAPSPLGHTPLDIGTTLTQSAELVAKNFALFATVAAVVFSPYLVWSIFNPPASRTPSLDDVDFLASTAAVMFLQWLLNGAVAHATFARLNGQPVRISECLIVAVDRFVSILGIFIIQAFIIGVPLSIAVNLILSNPLLGNLAILATVIIAVFVHITFWVAVPTTVIERVGPLQSLKRSKMLTDGNKRRIIALVFALLIIIVVVNIPVVAISAVGGPLTGLLGAAGQALIATITAAVTSVAYVQLRRAKE